MYLFMCTYTCNISRSPLSACILLTFLTSPSTRTVTIKQVAFDWVGPDVGLAWSDANDHAIAAGTRLPTADEFRIKGISDGDFDQWQPVSDGQNLWVQSGDAGRIYTTEGGETGWYDSNDVFPWRPTSEGSTSGSPVHHFYVIVGTEIPPAGGGLSVAVSLSVFLSLYLSLSHAHTGAHTHDRSHALVSARALSLCTVI